MRPDHTDDEFTWRIRDALRADPQLRRLLGGAILTDDTESDAAQPHIRIAESGLTDWGTNRQISGERIVTLQIWPCSADPIVAENLLSVAHGALQKAGMMEVMQPLQLHPQYSGFRRMPDSREYQCILRYHAIRHSEAA